MSHFRTLASEQTLRASTLDRLQMWLCNAIVSSNDLRRETTIIIRETDLTLPPTAGQRFTLALSPHACAVVCGVRQSSLKMGSPQDDREDCFEVQLAFERPAIQAFLRESDLNSRTGYRLPESLRVHATALLQNETDLSPWFERAALDLIAAWETEAELRAVLEHDKALNRTLSVNTAIAENSSNSEVSEVSEVSEIAATLQSQDLNPIASHASPTTSSSVDSETLEEEQADIILVDILRDTITRARRFLQLDRLAIYQFSHSTEITQPPTDLTEFIIQSGGSIVYEDLLSPDIGSLRHTSVLVSEFVPEGIRLETFIEPIAISTMSPPKVSKRGRRAVRVAPALAQVQSQVIVPLRVRDRLWGVLFAQQCRQPRSWSPYDLDFLSYVAADMSLAIQQAHAVAELQHQKYMIEQAAEQQTHQLNDALQTTQAARQTRTEFLSMMSHELRTPLACIIGMSSTLLRWSFGHLNDKQREYLTTIYDSGEHLLELIDDLLDLAELESGATQLRIAEFSLSQLARHIIRTAIDRATVNGIQLRLKLDIPNDLDQFRADRARVNQILFNLLSNAIKFTLTGGQVTLSVVREPHQVQFAIEDTGIGIPQGQQASLFESFRQLDGTYTREYGGTGLGLALTKQLVELHNGSIEVQSEPNVGSCFTVSLPQADEPASPEIAIPSALRTAPHIPQGHIVLVTSREEDATLVCDVLTAAGLQVIWMLDGSTALEQIRVLRPIVAIVDRRLDGIDGCELTSILRRSKETSTLRVVMIGNSDQPEETSLCLMSGADRCVAVPLNLEVLLTQVIELIELEADRTPKVKVVPGQS
jgi:two-component system sensor histidine kinase/response regulator